MLIAILEKRGGDSLERNAAERGSDEKVAKN